jgi:hypothetical protein
MVIRSSDWIVLLSVRHLLLVQKCGYFRFTGPTIGAELENAGAARHEARHDEACDRWPGPLRVRLARV